MKLKVEELFILMKTRLANKQVGMLGLKLKHKNTIICMTKKQLIAVVDKTSSSRHAHSLQCHYQTLLNHLSSGDISACDSVYSEVS